MRFTNTEWQVMDVLWANSPATVRAVLNALEGETSWSYSKVKTILRGLVDKGALSVERRGNAHHYTPIVSRDAVRRSALRSLLDRAFDGTGGSLGDNPVNGAKLGSNERDKLGELLVAAATVGAAKDENEDG